MYGEIEARFKKKEESMWCVCAHGYRHMRKEHKK